MYGSQGPRSTREVSHGVDSDGAHRRGGDARGVVLSITRCLVVIWVKVDKLMEYAKKHNCLVERTYLRGRTWP